MQTCPYCDFSPMPAGAAQCPRCGTELSERRPGSRQIPTTLFHSMIDSPAGRLGVGPDFTRTEQTPEKQRSPTRAEQRSQKLGPPQILDAADVRRFFPVGRPPLALLCLLDDGEDTGEWIRVRVPRVVIGRNEGDVLIPHDEAVSSRHAELSRELVDGEFRWIFKDLDSTNGTFARVSQSVLKHNQTLVLGCRSFRFDAAPRFDGHKDQLESGEAVPRKVTRVMKAVSADDAAESMPALIERLAEGDGERFALSGDDNWIGTDPKQTTLTLKDPYLDPRHARIFRDEQGRWQIEGDRNLNGTWLGIDQIEVTGSGEFQVGEQRIIVKVS